MKLEDWEAAGGTYEMLCQRFPVVDGMPFAQQGAMFRGAQECHYQMENYGLCILLGEDIMKKYRFTPSAHKATARAYKAIGNMDEARKLAAKAILNFRFARFNPQMKKLHSQKFVSYENTT